MIAQRYEIHPVQVSQWEMEVASRLPEVFVKPSPRSAAKSKGEGSLRRNRAIEDGARLAQKKLARVGSKERRDMINTKHPKLSVMRQSALLELPRSTYCHQPKPTPEADLTLMRVIDETFLAFPFFGSRQMTRWLRREGCTVNRKRVRRSMPLMGLSAIYRKPSLSKKAAVHTIYP